MAVPAWTVGRDVAAEKKTKQKKKRKKRNVHRQPPGAGRVVPACPSRVKPHSMELPGEHSVEKIQWKPAKKPVKLGKTR